MTRYGPCKSCRAEVLWVVTTRGKLMPVDPLPVGDGNIVLPLHSTTGGNTVVVLTANELAELEAGRIVSIPPGEHKPVDPVRGVEPKDARIGHQGMVVVPGLTPRFVAHFATCPSVQEHRA